MHSVPLGLLLGALNTLVIALGLSAVAGELGIAVFVLMIGIVPGAGLGAILGWTAQLMKSQCVWLRRIVLIVPAIMLVAALASQFMLDEFIVVASIPTVVAGLLLERTTREVTPPPVPIARKL